MLRKDLVNQVTHDIMVYIEETPTVERDRIYEIIDSTIGVIADIAEEQAVEMEIK